jgi:hypothetical protein
LEEGRTELRQQVCLWKHGSVNPIGVGMIAKIWQASLQMTSVEKVEELVESGLPMKMTRGVHDGGRL